MFCVCLRPSRRFYLQCQEPSRCATNCWRRRAETDPRTYGLPARSLRVVTMGKGKAHRAKDKYYFLAKEQVRTSPVGGVVCAQRAAVVCHSVPALPASTATSRDVQTAARARCTASMRSIRAFQLRVGWVRRCANHIAAYTSRSSTGLPCSVSLQAHPAEQEV